MSRREFRYQLMVAPGILHDDTYGIYAIPNDNPATEFHLNGQFENAEEAKTFCRGLSISTTSCRAMKSSLRTQGRRENSRSPNT